MPYNRHSLSELVLCLSFFLLHSWYADAYLKLIENSGQLPTQVSGRTPKSKENAAYPVIDFIQNAEKSLELEIYEMRSKIVQESIIAALKRGVIVHILAEPDPVGNSCDAFGKQQKHGQKCKKSRNFHKAFAAAKEQYSPKSSISYYNKKLCYDATAEKSSYCYQHGKIIIRDKKDVHLSTGNLNDSSICDPKNRVSNSCNRDFSIITDQENIVSSFLDIFAQDWKVSSSCDQPPKTAPKSTSKCKNPEIEIDHDVFAKKIHAILEKRKSSEAITVSPFLEEKIPAFLRSAKKRIQMQAQYLRDYSWFEALRAAQDKGVKIDLTLASLCHFNRRNGVGAIAYNTYFASDGYIQFWLNPLLENSDSTSLRIFSRGVPFEDEKRNGYLHAKIIIIDENAAWVGSTNGSYTSTHINREFGIFIRDKFLVKELSKFIALDHQKSMTIAQHIPNPTSLNHRINAEYGTCTIKK